MFGHSKHDHRHGGHRHEGQGHCGEKCVAVVAIM